MYTLWRRLSHRRTLKGLSGRAALFIRDDNTGVLARFRHHRARGWEWNTVRWVDTRRPWLVRWGMRKSSRNLGDLVPEGEYEESVAIPLWEQPLWARALRFVATLGVWLFAVVVLTVLAVPVELVSMITAVLYPFVFFLLPRVGPVSVRSLDQLPLDATNIVDYATRRLEGVHPEALDELPHREQVLGRINDIRAEYGGLKLDVLERIDRPALFDGAVPATAEFLSVLVQAEDANMETPIGELEALASRLEVTFEVAKSHAAAVGIQHVPEDKRDDARRAAKVARLAQESPNEGERRSAIAQLRRILESMALYYMPDVDEVRAIEW